jgi:hypothetical protein
MTAEPGIMVERDRSEQAFSLAQHTTALGRRLDGPASGKCASTSKPTRGLPGGAEVFRAVCVGARRRDAAV